MIARAKDGELIGARISGKGPFFTKIPENLVEGGHRKLQLGDLVEVSEWEDREGYEVLGKHAANGPNDPEAQVGDEVWAHQNWIIIGARPLSEQISYPLRANFSSSRVGLTLAAMSAVVAHQRDVEERRLIKHSVTSMLYWLEDDKAKKKTVDKTILLRFFIHTKDLKELQGYWKTYEEDANVHIKRPDHDTKVCGYGEIRQARKNITRDGYNMEIVMAARFQDAKNYEQGFDDWHDLVTSEWEARIIPISNTKMLHRRELTLMDGLPWSLAQSDHPIAPIASALLGRERRDPPPPQHIGGIVDEHPALQTLNEQQLLTVAMFLDTRPRVIFNQAPPGTGKTWVSGAAIAAAIQRDPKAVILATAPINVAVCELAEDTDKAMRMAGQQVPMLAIFSGNGKARYMERIRQVGEHLVVHRVKDEDIREELMKKSGKLIQKYERDWERAPRRAQERAASFEVSQLKKFRVFFMTMALAEEFQSFLDASMASPRENKSHPSIVRCLEASVYRPAGEQFRAGLTVEQRNLLTDEIGINLPVQTCPIVLIHQNTMTMQDATSFSLTNPGHTETAMALIDILSQPLLARRKRILVICFYMAQMDVIKEQLEARQVRNVSCSTVDSIQSQEADIVLLITTKTRTGSAKKVEEETATFWTDPQRSNVALSRARFGLFIIGDLTILCKHGAVWSRFIHEARSQTVVVTPEYVRLMLSGNTQRVDGVLTDFQGRMPVAEDHYGEVKHTEGADFLDTAMRGYEARME
uniref:RNA helicase n=1 Tax=Meloidogyne javanica TaxID=6303 RepID=A0A915LMX6_MELJA